MIQFIDYLRQRPQAAKLALYLIVFAILLWSFSVDSSHGHTWLERHLPGFWSLFGFISSVVLIFVARWLSQAGISREEDYYER